MAEGIKVVPFEAHYQSAVTELFTSGLTTSYQHRSATVQACQKKFTRVKLSAQGDMRDIYSSFMSSGDECRYFWVAIDDLNRVVGHVGVVPSTYSTDETRLYDPAKGITPDTVAELVRMSVHKDMRGKGIGKELCRVLEEYSKSKGIKRVVLSTLCEMDLAVTLYRKCGYNLVMETPIDTAEWLGPGDWDPLFVAHFSKDLVP